MEGVQSRTTQRACGQPTTASHRPHDIQLMLTRILLTACLLLTALTPAAAEDDDTPATNIEVRFDGVSDAMLDNVEASVSLNRQSEQDLSETRIRFLHSRASDEIRQALKVFGYYSPDIQSNLTQTQDGWLAEYTIKPGEPVTIDRIDIRFTGEGADTDTFKELRADHPFRQGARLEHQVYDNYRNRIDRRARELGYFDAIFKRREMRVDPKARRADIVLEFDTGPRYHYGPVSFSETPLAADFLRNYLPFAEGDPYDSRDPLELRKRLIDSDMFTSVNVRPDETAGDDLEVPVDVELEPRKPHRYTAGVGFATDTGPRLRLGWDARYLNERGHRFDSDLRLSPVTSTLSGTYLMPYFRDREADVGVRGSLNNEDTDTSKSRSGQATLFQNTTRWGWNETLSASYLVEDFEVADDRNTTKLFIPGASWWQSWSDDPIYARRGGRLSLDLKGAAEPLLSDTSFIQATVSGKYVRALGWRNRLLARVKLGATEVTDFSKLPASLRFFAGGDNSIRGYGYQTLGPENDDGEVVGGRYLFVGSVEYEQFVYKDYGVATFVDFGNAMNSFSDPLEVGAGVGLRWLSPVGLIKLDVAAAVTEEGTPLRLHISLGADL